MTQGFVLGQNSPEYLHIGVILVTDESRDIQVGSCQIGSGVEEFVQILSSNHMGRRRHFGKAYTLDFTKGSVCSQFGKFLP